MTQKPMLRAEVYARALRASQSRKEDSEVLLQYCRSSILNGISFVIRSFVRSFVRSCPLFLFVLYYCEVLLYMCCR